MGRAVELLRRNFDIARRLLASGDADAASVDRARVHLGVALGNERLGRYLRAIDVDFSGLLAWKNARQPLTDGAAGGADDDDDSLLGGGDGGDFGEEDAAGEDEGDDDTETDDDEPVGGDDAPAVD